MVVPDYQRAYTWDVAKVEELIQDWEEYIATTPKQTYYMGSVLLFTNKKDNYQIIDGQQRLTTLAIIYYQLYDSLLDGQDVQYNQSISGFNIAKNLNFAKQAIVRLEKLKASEIFSKLEFTVIVSDNQDHAFETGLARRGENSLFSKLTEKDILDILKKYSEKYGCR